MSTTDDKYIPTPAEKKLLEVLLNPEYYTLSVTDICSMANVVRDVYYDALKKPEFVEFYNKALIEIMKGKVDDVLKATYNFAISNPRCHQDRKVILEMAGLYTEKTKQEVIIEDKTDAKERLINRINEVVARSRENAIPEKPDTE